MPTHGNDLTQGQVTKAARTARNVRRVGSVLAWPTAPPAAPTPLGSCSVWCPDRLKLKPSFGRLWPGLAAGRPGPQRQVRGRVLKSVFAVLLGTGVAKGRGGARAEAVGQWAEKLLSRHKQILAAADNCASLGPRALLCVWGAATCRIRLSTPASSRAATASCTQTAGVCACVGYRAAVRAPLHSADHLVTKSCVDGDGWCWLSC